MDATPDPAEKTETTEAVGQDNGMGETTWECYAIQGVPALKLDNVPRELKALDRWVAWRAIPAPGKAKPGKCPVNPRTGGNAMSDNPSTWGTFAQAVDRATKDGLAGIGIMFGGDDLTGIDLDNVCRRGELRNHGARAIARGIDSYTEVSPSGTGIKTWILSTARPGWHKKTLEVIAPSGDRESVECEAYNSGKFFCVTGHIMPEFGGGAVNERSGEFAGLMALGNGARPKAKPTGRAAPAGPSPFLTGGLPAPLWKANGT